MSPDNHGFAQPDHAWLEPPPVSAAFRWDREHSLLVLRCVPLAGRAQHVFTCVQPPLSSADETVASASSGPATGPDPVAQASAALGVEPCRVMRVRQVHGRAVRVVRANEPATSNPDERPDGDALIADAPGLALSVRVADCVPILLAATSGGVAAAVHAGWRGTCAGVAAVTVAALAREFGTPPSTLVAGIGPGIGPLDYEVGDEVRQAFVEAGHAAADLARWFRPGRAPGRWWLNLWAANTDQLRAAGVPAAAIHAAGVSTVPHPGWFESYRRDGPRAGRMAALIVVPQQV